MYNTLTDFYGKKIALLLHFLNENKEKSAVLVTGTAFFQDGYLRLHRGSSIPPLPIPLKIVWRAIPVKDDIRDIVGDADFLMEGTIAEIPQMSGGNQSFRKSA